MAQADHARRYRRLDGATVRAAQFDGSVAGYYALLAAFPGRFLPHPHRDDRVLMLMENGRRVPIWPGDWVTEQPDGSLQTDPEDQFLLRQDIDEAIAA